MSSIPVVRYVVISAAVSLLALPAAAQPSALVEDIQAAGSDLSFMDYVEPGDVVKLSAGERLVLGYFASCMQETITGGTVTIGKKASAVAGGTVRKVEVPCDGGQVELSRGQANDSGVVAFRGTGDAAAKPGVRPELTLYGASPLVRSGVAGSLLIERVDRPGDPVEMDIPPGATDLATKDVALEAGGVYRARFSAADGERMLVFDIDAFAEAGDQPKLSRLIRF